MENLGGILISLIMIFFMFYGIRALTLDLVELWNKRKLNKTLKDMNSSEITKYLRDENFDLEYLKKYYNEENKRWMN